MAEFIIKGNQKLSGTITTNTSKNGALVVIIASLLNKKSSIIEDVPNIEEIKRLIEILSSIGVKIKYLNPHKLKITPPKKFDLKNLDKDAAQKTRIIILFASVLGKQMNNFSLPICGGCKLGKRSINPHIEALKELGIDIKVTAKNHIISTHKKISKEIIMSEAGDTATENAIMAAALTPKVTTIKYASANYQVQDLCFYLKKCGIKIEGIGTSTIKVYGKKIISKKVEYAIAPDPIESMLFLSIAATTNSELTIKNCPIEFLELELLKLKQMGFDYKIIKRYLAKNTKTPLVDIKTKKSKLFAPADKVDARPYPGINIDNLPFFVPVATQAKGKTLIHDWMYENRASYYTALNKLGAKIKQVDPHRVFVTGPTKLKATNITAPPALRPSAIILVAMLAAKGNSTLKNIYGIERGYEDLAKRLSKLGANIERIEK